MSDLEGFDTVLITPPHTLVSLSYPASTVMKRLPGPLMMLVQPSRTVLVI